MKRILFLIFLSPWLLLAQYPQMDFPLQIGNRWQYSEFSGTVEESRVTGDTIMTNGNTYARIEGILFSGFYRQEGSQVFSYDISQGTESLEYDFSLKTGDTLSVEPLGEDTLVTIVSAQGMTPIFEEERYAMWFLTDDFYSSWDAEKKIVDGIGFVQYAGEVFFYGLTGAVINGVSYGEVVHVENSTSQLPDNFCLLQNYPNPFNPSTTIRYGVPRSGHVTISIYNILGQEVERLLDSEQSPGYYEVRWQADQYAAGIYFYRIQAGHWQQVKRMLLLK